MSTTETNDTSDETSGQPWALWPPRVVSGYGRMVAETIALSAALGPIRESAAHYHPKGGCAGCRRQLDTETAVGVVKNKDGSGAGYLCWRCFDDRDRAMGR